MPCTLCKKTFEIHPDDLKFLDKISPVFNEKKYPVPPPTLCPDCRLQRRFSWRNDRNLYERTCDKSGKKLISMFRPDSKIKVWDKDIWWSDAWDARDYGRNFDFTRPFFEQFQELNESVPTAHVITLLGENSLYTNYTAYNKNCYLCFAGNYLEDSMYCYNAENSKDCVDNLFLYKCELCYQCIQSQNCYKCQFVVHSRQCTESAFLEDCQNCENCFLCFNLERKKYCILNKQYSREEYFKILESYKLETFSGQQKALALWKSERLKYPKRSNHNLSTENCTGEYITQSKNCRNCFMMSENGEDCAYIFNGFPGLKDAMDCTYCGEKAVLHYECTCTGDNTYNILFGNICTTGSHDLFYCSYMIGSENCFGCSNMKKAKYCILNKQYSKEEYEKMVARIIEHMGGIANNIAQNSIAPASARHERGDSEGLGLVGPKPSESELYDNEWGEFFPSSISAFGYNESVAQEYFPMTKEEALKTNFLWSDYENPKSKIAGMEAKKLPETFGETSEEFFNTAIVCEISGKPFRITKQEVDFYKKMNLPIPHRSPDQRHLDRLALKNSYKLYSRTCAKCNTSIQTSYAPGRPEIVYCENCYKKEVY